MSGHGGSVKERAGEPADADAVAAVGGGSAVPLRLRLLGGWAIDGIGDDLGRVPLTVRRILTYLALRGPACRRELAADIWPEASECHAHGSLRTALWRARALHPALLSCDGDTAALGRDVSVDVTELASDVRRLQSGEVVARLRDLPEALLGGDLVPGWYDDWLLLERERVRQLRLHALEGLAYVLADEGAYVLALEAAVAAVRAEPLRESAHRALVAVHLREGNRSEALRHYQSFRELLQQELGVAPSPLLDDLVRPLGSLARQRRPADPQSRDLDPQHADRRGRGAPALTHPTR